MSENMTQLLERLAAVTVERDALAAELAKLRAQEPVAYLDYWKSDGTGIVRKQRTTGVPFFNSPVPALAELDSPMDIHDLAYELGGTDSGEYHLEPEDLDRIVAAAQAMAAVPDWNVNIDRIRDVMHMLGISIDESVECFSAALPTNINRMTLAMKRHLQEMADMTAAPDVSGELVEAGGCAPAIVTTPFIPDADTRRNDEAFAAQQAAPSVPDCLTCDNLGRINGLSQESYCDSCVYEGRGWRQNHFVDARKMADTAKRRCEACAILPCSCK